MEQPLQDHLKKGLKIIFVGFNPSIKSGQTGHHYSNPNNRFYTILHQAGLTDRKLNATEDAKLLELGYGLTNIVDRPTKAATDITKEEYNQGRENLKNKIEFYRPNVVCFVGKGVYQEYSKKREVQWGVQPDSLVKGVKDFVAPSSSGLVRMRMDQIVKIYSQLKSIL